MSFSLFLSFFHLTFLPTEYPRNQVMIPVQEDEALLPENDEQRIDPLEWLTQIEPKHPLRTITYTVYPHGAHLRLRFGTEQTNDGVVGTEGAEDRHAKVPHDQWYTQVERLTLAHVTLQQHHGRHVEKCDDQVEREAIGEKRRTSPRPRLRVRFRPVGEKEFIGTWQREVQRIGDALRHRVLQIDERTLKAVFLRQADKSKQTR
jgi:hypothetical protein